MRKTCKPFYLPTLSLTSAYDDMNTNILIEKCLSNIITTVFIVDILCLTCGTWTDPTVS